MRRISLGTVFLIAGAFFAGLICHFLYQRWTAPLPENQVYAVSFSPLPVPASKQAEIPLFQARDVERIKGYTGNQARIRGRVYRVGHSTKSDTYFLNFGPSRASFTAVIFASALEAFEKKSLHPKSFEEREVELRGEIKDHPKYGLEMILEDPSQIKVLE
jgi:hypothetical protein